MTVANSGIDRVVQANNLLSNVGNQNRGAVLAEPFPCLVSQWVARAFTSRIDFRIGRK